MAAPPNDYDSPWKEALEHYLPDFLCMFLPDLYAQMDWAQPPVFLDKELQAITQGAANGRRIADKLVLVRLRRTGQPDCLLLIHIEIQSGRITASTFLRMGERMYRYFYRISDRLLQAHIRREPTRVAQRLVNRGRKNHENKVHMAGNADIASAATSATTSATHDVELFSLCILTAATSGPPALTYIQGHFGHGVQFSCPVVYLSEWLEKWGELELQAKTNPFAVVIMAQLLAQRTHGKDTERFASKTRIVELLYRYKYSRADVLQLLRLIDWMMTLPAHLEPLFDQAVEAIEQENKMAFITSFERLGEQRGREKGIAIGMEKGLKTGLLKGKLEGRLEGEATLLQRLLTRKFGILPDAIGQRIRNATPAQLETWSLNILEATSLDDVFRD